MQIQEDTQACTMPTSDSIPVKLGVIKFHEAGISHVNNQFAN